MKTLIALCILLTACSSASSDSSMPYKTIEGYSGAIRVYRFEDGTANCFIATYQAVPSMSCVRK